MLNFITIFLSMIDLPGTAIALLSEIYYICTGLKTNIVNRTYERSRHTPAKV